jgi:hypothetical protein
MPLAQLKFNPSLAKGSEWEDFPIREFTKKLQKIVANSLNVKGHPDAQLTPKDVDIEVSESGTFDINNYFLEIRIDANLYSEREVTLGSRTKSISYEVKKLLPKSLCTDNQVAVWVRLFPAHFVCVK